MKTLVVDRDRTEYSKAIGDEGMIQFGRWVSDTRRCLLSAVDATLINDFIEWLLTTGHGSQALRLINECPRQLFLPFDPENPPWRWVDDGDQNPTDDDGRVTEAVEQSAEGDGRVSGPA